jgi:predicted transcriptional regulator
MRAGVVENREHIYECISKSPGIHLRGIYREAKLSMGNTQHHLLALEKEGVIKSRKINGNRHYYPIAISAERDELFLGFLRKNL